ncbi:MAG: ATP synthase F0 subunit A [Chloroflexi bacterium RBG_16_50_9]|nr:MAG: ATP synthase F0 subunit A [Chloroflexi bacterium RBG_16_50_9]
MIIVIIALVIFIMGFLAGPIGSNLFGEMEWLRWMSIEAPEMHLPAPVLFYIFNLPITNTILAGWITFVFLVLISWVVTRRMKLVPGRLQAAFEFLLGWMYDFCKSVAGEENGRKFFPVICTIFLFVLFNAWLSLIPGFGSILFGHHELLRGANTDVNTPLAIAFISFVFVEYYGLKTLGIHYLRKFINMGRFFGSIGKVFKGKVREGLSGLFSGFVDIFVGGLETLSEFIRIVSFTFRLFGNMTAGEILLLIAAYLVPWVAALPFYGLELLVGVVQALIFGGLTLVFVSLAVTPHEAEAH